MMAVQPREPAFPATTSGWVTPAEGAVRLGVTPATLLHEYRRQRLPGRRLGGRQLLFHVDALDSHNPSIVRVWFHRDRRPTDRARYDRVRSMGLRLARVHPGEQGPSRSELAKELNLSERQVQADLKRLGEWFTFEVVTTLRGALREHGYRLQATGTLDASADMVSGMVDEEE